MTHVGPRAPRWHVALVVAALAVAACSGAPPATSTDGGPLAGQQAASAPEGVPPLHPSVDGYPTGTVEVQAGDGTWHRVAVRVATTSSQREHGLMEVPDLPAGTGMWFVYDEERTGTFWMKDTLVPLDIAFVGADGRIVSIADAVPCEAAPCPSYAPPGPYLHVLEVPAGYLDRIGAGPGSAVRRVDG